jgi:D-beta-D-heptose 7-phosphate kinase/D-beta-D-heptose 1-phosphate adenosyltransferase
MNSSADTLVLDEAELQAFCDGCREHSRTMVLATGGFDLLHPGHLRFLEKVSELGDVLIVGINDDAYIRRAKGANRPLQNEQDRAFLVAGFRCVDVVHVITPKLIQIVRPDIFVMSTSSVQKPEKRKLHHDLIGKYGGKVVVYDAFSNVHSSELIAKLDQKPGAE